MTFWLVFALLVLVAATLVVAPLLRRPVDLPPDAGRRRAEMRAHYRDRLAELDREQAAGQLDPQAREQVLAELDANLYDEFQAADASPASASGAPSAPPRLALWLTLVLLPAAAVAIYLSSGEPGAGDIAGAAEVLRLDPNADRARLEVWRDRLSARTVRRPEDAQSWYLLGVSGLQLNSGWRRTGTYPSHRWRSCAASDPASRRVRAPSAGPSPDRSRRWR
jgi:cytochrome c-type biogenesis protein CcmH